MLHNLVSGKECPKHILIHENSNCKADRLVQTLLVNLDNRVSAVHLFSYQRSPNCFNESKVGNGRLITYDGFSDPLGWNSSEVNSRDSSGCLQINIDADIVKIVKEESLKRCTNQDEPAKAAVVFDNLSVLLRHKTVHEVCVLLKTFCSLKCKGVEICQVVAVISSDVVSDTILKSLDYVFSCVIKINSVAEEKAMQRNITSISDNQQSFHCDILLKRKSGKVQREVAEYCWSSDMMFTKLRSVKGSSKSIQEEREPDPAANLTFNLRLTDSEKEARSQVKLPYTYDEKRKAEHLHRSVGEGKIFYQFDEADDFDEEDPDDDLDI